MNRRNFIQAAIATIAGLPTLLKGKSRTLYCVDVGTQTPTEAERSMVTFREGVRPVLDYETRENDRLFAEANNLLPGDQYLKWDGTKFVKVVYGNQKQPRKI